MKTVYVVIQGENMKNKQKNNFQEEYNMKFKKYKKIGITEMIEYDPDLTYPKEIMDNLSISPADKRNGSPKKGDMIARNPDNPGDYWLVAREYFEKNYAEVEK